MEGKSIGIIMSVAVALLMGAILIQVIADQTVSKTKLQLVTETINKAPARLEGGTINETYFYYPTKLANSGWREDNVGECSVSTVTMRNGSGYEMDNNGCASDGDFVYVVDTRLNLCNSVTTNSSVSNTTTLTYQACPDEYIPGWGNTIMNMIPGFFALAMLIGGAFVIFYILKQEGIELKI